MNYLRILSLGSLFGLCSVANAAQTETSFLSATRYNLAGQVTGTIGPDPDGPDPLGHPAVRNTYDARTGLLEKTEYGELSAFQSDEVQPKDWDGFSVKSSKSYVYNDLGRMAAEQTNDAAGNAIALTQYDYHQTGTLSCKAVRMNPNSFDSLPASACELAPKGAYGVDRIFKYFYHASNGMLHEEHRAVHAGAHLEQVYQNIQYVFGKPRLITDANGNATELHYDNHNRLYRRHYPVPAKGQNQANASDYNEYKYDSNGNLVWERKRNGAIIEYAYDNNDRVLRKFGTGLAREIYYEYDLRGLALSSRFDQPFGEGVENTFDGFGRLATTINTMDGRDRELRYTYDLNGNRTSLTHADNQQFSYRFDGLNRVTGVGEGSSTTNVLTLNYQGNGRRDEILRNGSGATTVYGFDAAQRLDSLNQDVAGTASDLTIGFKYNPAGQIREMQKSNSDYHYTGNANRTGRYVPNGLNQYTQINGKSLAYDGNGNLVEDGQLVYEYDNENRLIHTTDETASSFEYDPLGRLFRVSIGNANTEFLYDGDALIAEYNDTALARRYVHGDQVDEPWVQYNGSAVGGAQRRYLHVDHQGSIIAHSNGSGAVLDTLAYDSYGIPAQKNIGRFGYTGQVWLKELGLFHYKARMYSPQLGRFLQTDPIFYEDQMNMYAYVGNDPVNMVDPTGEVAIPGALIGAGLEALIQYKTGQLSMSFGSIAKIGTAAASGAIGAGLAGGVARFAATRVSPAITNVAGNAAAGMLVGGASKVAGNAIDGKSGKDLMGGVGVSATVGAVMGGAGSGVSEGMKAGIKSLAGKPNGITYHVAETSGAAVERGSPGAIGAAEAGGSVIGNSNGAVESSLPKVNCSPTGNSQC